MRYGLILIVLGTVAVVSFGAGADGHTGVREQFEGFSQEQYSDYQDDYNGFWYELVGVAIVRPTFSVSELVVLHSYDLGTQYQWVDGSLLVSFGPILGIVSVLFYFISTIPADISGTDWIDIL